MFQLSRREESAFYVYACVYVYVNVYVNVYVCV